VAYHDPVIAGAPGHGEGHNSGQALNITAALAIKSAGADGVVAVMAEASDLGVANSLATIGYKPKVELYIGVGYDQQTVSDPTTKAAAENDYFSSQFQPLETNSSATKRWSQELQQYAGVTGIPGLNAVRQIVRDRRRGRTRILAS